MPESVTGLVVAVVHPGRIRKRRCGLALATVALSSLKRGARGAPGGSGQKETHLKGRNNRNPTPANCVLDLGKLKNGENGLI